MKNRVFAYASDGHVTAVISSAVVKEEDRQVAVDLRFQGETSGAKADAFWGSWRIVAGERREEEFGREDSDLEREEREKAMDDDCHFL